MLEADGAGLRTGLAASFVIEGRPGEEHQATVTKVEPAFMKPGQRVRAVVRLEEAQGVLAIPRSAVFDKDGRRVVYRKQAGRFAPVEVTIAQQSISRVVVTKGLAAGDVVALRDPTAKPGAVGSTEAGK